MCSHRRPCALYAGLGTTLTPPPQQMLTVSWTWPGRDNRGQSTRSVPKETSAQDEELTKGKKKKEEKPPARAMKETKRIRAMGLPGGLVTQRSSEVVAVMMGLGQWGEACLSTQTLEVSGFRALCHLVPRLTL